MKAWLLFGWLAELFTKLHFRFEVKSAARTYGFNRGEMRHLSRARLGHLFDLAWKEYEK